MAEVGTIISIVSLAGATLEGLKTLCLFFRSIRDVPEEVSILSTELLLVQKIIENLYPQIRNIELEPYQVGLELALNNCNRAVVRLKALIQRHYPSGHKKSHKRYWKQIVVAFKKEDFKKHIAHLERAKASILAAQASMGMCLQMTAIEHLKQSSALLDTNQKTCIPDITDFVRSLEGRLTNVESLNNSTHESKAVTVNALEKSSAVIAGNSDVGISRISESDSQLPSRTFKHFIKTSLYNFDLVCSSTWLLRTSFATVIIRKSQHRYKKTHPDYDQSIHKDFSTRIVDVIILPASWISVKGAIITLERMIQRFRKPSLTLRLEPVRIISRRSMVYQACNRGDLRAVRQLFESGHASPCDRTEDGQNLLFAVAESVWENIHDLKTDTGVKEDALFHIKQTEELIHYLIKHGVNPKEPDVSRISPIVSLTSEIAHDLVSKALTVDGVLPDSPEGNHYMNALEILVSFPGGEVSETINEMEEILYEATYTRGLNSRPIFRLHVPWMTTRWDYMVPEQQARYRKQLFSCGDLDICSRSDMLSMPYQKLQKIIEVSFYNLQQMLIIGKPNVKLPKASPRRSLLWDAIIISSVRLHDFLENASGNQPDERYHLLERSVVKNLKILLDYGYDPLGKSFDGDEFADQDWSKAFGPTDLARQHGILDLWREALLQGGYNADMIIGGSASLENEQRFENLKLKTVHMNENLDTKRDIHSRTKMAAAALVFVENLVFEICKTILLASQQSLTALLLLFLIAILLIST